MFFKKKDSALDYIVVGLGNPGKKYDYSRHNTGFRMMDALACSLGTKVTRARFQSLCGTVNISGAKVMLLKPTTYMNLSGIAVREAANYYKVAPENIIVIYDDVSLDAGALRIRAEGSAGGHNGIKSLIEQLGTDKFPRIKVGVGQKPGPDYDLADWVLSMPSSADRKAIEARTDDVCEAVELLVQDRLQMAQSRFN
ncbi:MAG: aminoacyl-tRNA hydrolase [Oscillospiraceae bacterium]